MFVVIMVQPQQEIIDTYSSDYTSITDIQDVIKGFKAKYRVPNSNIIADEDGVGGGVVDTLNIKGFVNGSKAVNENYNRLKDECGYKLSEKIIAPTHGDDITWRNKLYIKENADNNYNGQYILGDFVIIK